VEQAHQKPAENNQKQRRAEGVRTIVSAILRWVSASIPSKLRCFDGCITEGTLEGGIHPVRHHKLIVIAANPPPYQDS
jgi:hypothetical protein